MTVCTNDVLGSFVKSSATVKKKKKTLKICLRFVGEGYVNLNSRNNTTKYMFELCSRAKITLSFIRIA